MRDIFITIGDSRVLVLRVKDQNYNDADMTDAKITFTVKENFYDDDADAVIQKTTADDINIVDAENGVVQIALKPADTDPNQNPNLELLTYEYDIQVELGADAFTTNKGTITFTKRITEGYLNT